MSDRKNLETMAIAMRRDIIRMLAAAGSGHPGSSLSCVDILASLFFSGIMEYNCNDPNDRSGDRFLLSKGHAAPALYAVYRRLGWLSDDELLTLRCLGSRLQGHPDAKFLPAVEVCSGSLGQGLAVGAGLALALAWDDDDVTRRREVYVLCGDGEMQEGSNWEALAFAAHYGLHNLTLLVDLNGLQIDGSTDEVCSLRSLSTKLDTFGWAVRFVDGHDVDALTQSLAWARKFTGGPQAIVCDTVKGKGVSFMEGVVGWHGRVLTHEEAQVALSELDARSSLNLGMEDWRD